MLAVNKPASSFTSVLLSTVGRPSFLRATGGFILRASGRHPDVRAPLVCQRIVNCSVRQVDTPTSPISLVNTSEAARPYVGCDEATFVANVSYYLADVASAVLLVSEHTEQSSSIRNGCFFPTSFGWTLSYRCSDLGYLLEERKRVVCGRKLQKKTCGIQGARDCLVFFRFSRRLSSSRFFLHCLAASLCGLLSGARASQR